MSSALAPDLKAFGQTASHGDAYVWAVWVIDVSAGQVRKFIPSSEIYATEAEAQSALDVVLADLTS